MIESDAFGPLTAELRRAEANHHDLAVLLPRLVRTRDFGDADDIVAVMRHRFSAATARSAGVGRTRRAPRLIVGLVPEGMGAVADDMRQALNERRGLIAQRADAVLDKAVNDSAHWIASLSDAPAAGPGRERWLLAARTIAAYRDRYQITTATALGALPESTAQKVDRARAEAALSAITAPPSPATRNAPQRVRRKREGRGGDSGRCSRLSVPWGTALEDTMDGKRLFVLERIF